MRPELHRGQVRKIIDEAMELAATITLRDTITLNDLYKLAEALKGSPLTTKEKQTIAGIVRKNYPAKRELQNDELQILIVL